LASQFFLVTEAKRDLSERQICAVDSVGAGVGIVGAPVVGAGVGLVGALVGFAPQRRARKSYKHNRLALQRFREHSVFRHRQLRGTPRHFSSCDKVGEAVGTAVVGALVGAVGCCVGAREVGAPVVGATVGAGVVGALVGASDVGAEVVGDLVPASAKNGQLKLFIRWIFWHI